MSQRSLKLRRYFIKSAAIQNIGFFISFGIVVYGEPNNKPNGLGQKLSEEQKKYGKRTNRKITFLLHLVMRDKGTKPPRKSKRGTE